MSLVPRNKAIVNGVQHKALLRSICGYCTVLETATNISSGEPPADLLAVERSVMFSERRSFLRSELSPHVATMREWKERIAKANTGDLTKRLIPDVGTWCLGRQGDLDFNTTQVLSGHGCFGVYLHKIGKEASDMYHQCNSGSDNAEHRLVECLVWDEEQLQFKRATDTTMSVDSVVLAMLSSPANWQAVKVSAKAVMNKKETDERERERLDGPRARKRRGDPRAAVAVG